MERLITDSQIRAAAEVLAPVVHRTPLSRAAVLDGESTTQVHVKCENLQRGGSFKIRGAYARLAGLTENERARGVVAASGGNYGEALALAAAQLGVRATVFMPERAPMPRLEATRMAGADVHARGLVLDESIAEATRFAAQHDAVYVTSCDHLDVLGGYGTLGLELLDQLPEVATVLVPAGSGALVGGVAAAIKATKPSVRVVAVQSSRAASLSSSLAAGSPVRIRSTRTVADGLAVNVPPTLAFDHVAAFVDEVVTVGEEALASAVLRCLERTRMVVEPSGAAAVAALIEHPGRFTGPVVSVLSGGNMDPLLLLRLVRHGMSVDGRLLSIRMRVPDRPGELAGLLALLGDLGGNCIDVEQSRMVGALAMGEVDLLLNLETRGAQHCTEIVESLQRGGYQILSVTKAHSTHT